MCLEVPTCKKCLVEFLDNIYALEEYEREEEEKEERKHQEPKKCGDRETKFTEEKTGG